jgi:hypothetical protein
MDGNTAARADRGERRRDEHHEVREQAERTWRMARAIYPANPGLPHLADLIPARR